MLVRTDFVFKYILLYGQPFPEENFGNYFATGMTQVVGKYRVANTLLETYVLWREIYLLTNF